MERKKPSVSTPGNFASGSRAVTDDSVTESRVATALQEYLVALEAGEPIPRGEFLNKHKDIAPQLLECLKSLDLVHAAARELDPPPVSSQDVSFDIHKQPLGDFQIIREIGRGGMGIVYEGRQLSLNRRVAVKVLPFVAALDPKYLQRFKNEARSAAQLHHPNIVPVYAVGTERGVHYYAMQLIEGYSLADLIHRRREQSGKISDITIAATAVEAKSQPVGPPSSQPKVEVQPAARAKPSASTAAGRAASTLLSNASANDKNPLPYYRSIVTWIKQAAAALDHAHQVGIIHRDIKPANLLVDGGNNVWITDFGLALFNNDLQITRTGDMVGTLRYMSPEQASGDRVVLDHRADIYGLGATLYELLTLEYVIEGKDAKSLLKQILNDDPKLPRGIDPRIPVELETIVLKALAKSPKDRYATAAQMADDLQRWLDDKPIHARRPTIGERAARWGRRNQGIVAATAAFSFVASLALLAGLLFISRSYQAESEARQAADKSFREAWQAVDAFTQLSEEEFQSKPQQIQVRRKFLATALDFYNKFLEERGNDPTVKDELAETKQYVEQMMREMSALERIGPLMLLSNYYVQQDLKLTSTQTSSVTQLMAQGFPKRESQDFLEQATAFEQEFEAVVTKSQLQRVQQIALQQRGPFVFKTPEVKTALGLTTEQISKINQIIEENRPDMKGGPGHGPPEHGPGDFGPGGPGDRRPGFDDRRGPPPDDRLGPGFDDRPPPEFGGEGFGGFDKKKKGPPPRGPEGRGGPGFEGREPPPGERGRPPFDDRGPPPDFEGPGPRRGPGGPQGELSTTMHRTVEKILEILTPAQREKWKEMVGEPFPYDLHWRPDEVLPRG